MGSKRGVQSEVTGEASVVATDEEKWVDAGVVAVAVAAMGESCCSSR